LKLREHASRGARWRNASAALAVDRSADTRHPLRELSGDISRPEITDDALLQHVSGLSVDLMSISVGTGYRMHATRAYA